MEISVKSSRLRSVMLLIVVLGLIVAFLYYLYMNADKYKDLLDVSITQVLALLGLSLVSPLINGLLNTYLFRSIGAAISYKDSFLLTAASTLANQLPISGGVMSKGFYLKRKYGVSYTKFLSTTLASYFCFIATSGFIGVAILLYWILFKKMAVSPVLLIGFSSMMSCCFIFWLPLQRIRMPGGIHKWIHEAVEGWVLMSKNPALLLKMVGLQTILLLLASIKYWLSFHMLSQEVTLSETMLFAAGSILAQLISITPGELGIRELIVGTIASTIGFDMGVSVVAVGLDRLVSTFTIFLAGGISTVILGSQIFDSSMKPEELL